MESGPTQAVLPLVGLTAEKVIRDRYNTGVGTKVDRADSGCAATEQQYSGTVLP
ncbi:MAG: hypothetical protein R6U98_15350 [Pirellulaceae bacterium]